MRDVRVNEQGVLEWATDKPKLHREVTEYFNNRKEGPKEARNKSAARPEEDMWASADRQRKGRAGLVRGPPRRSARRRASPSSGQAWRLAALGGGSGRRRAPKKHKASCHQARGHRLGRSGCSHVHVCACASAQADARDEVVHGLPLLAHGLPAGVQAHLQGTHERE